MGRHDNYVFDFLITLIEIMVDHIVNSINIPN
jgi:hypothetical protein